MSRISPYTILNIFRSFRTLPFWIKLVWRLFKDRRVPFRIKLIPLAALVYLISPLDFIPDLLVPVFGFADDLAILFFSFSIFVRLCPRDVVSEHIAKINNKG
ncbi:MAG TPA: DUF1232 domain-containing protein [Nitrospinota bacterium]|jgi:uncharacterized membrane protein YkvA (DUF1232 family)|nr:DUF1232 domain-containing protein [Nitrospinota bacterium]